MKKETIALIVVAILVIVVGIQAYYMSRMNDRLDRLMAQSKAAEDTRLNPPKMPAPARPQLVPDHDVFKDSPWNPYDEMRRMQDQMEHLFNESMSRFQLNTPSVTLNKTPDIDLQDRPERYAVTVNAPGADESSVEVKLDEQRLSVSIKTEQSKDESDDPAGQFRYRERFVGEFRRLVTLPGPADATKMKTDYRNGVLTITIPKK